MKKVFLVVTAALAVISLAACGPGTSKKNPEKSPQTEQGKKINPVPSNHRKNILKETDA